MNDVFGLIERERNAVLFSFFHKVSTMPNEVEIKKQLHTASRIGQTTLSACYASTFKPQANAFSSSMVYSSHPSLLKVRAILTTTVALLQGMSMAC